MTAPTTTTTQRAYATYTPKWQRFQSTLIISSTQVSGKKGDKQQQQQFPYQRQYSHVYHQRLAMLGPRCWERILDEEQQQQQQQQQEQKMHDRDNTTVDITNSTKVQRILDLRENVPSLVVGVLVKETTSTAADGGGSSGSGSDSEPTLHPDSHCKASDALYLEDESGRVSLGFSTKKQPHVTTLHEFPTGVVVGLQGTVGTDGVMLVDAVFTPKLPPPVAALSSLSPPTDLSDENNKKNTSSPPHLLLLSGLRCGAADVSSLPRDMLLSFLQGNFGTEKAACVSQVVIAGGLIHCDSKQQQQQQQQQQHQSKNETTAALRDLDAFLVQLTASGIPVTVLPGQDDPTTANWPQRPLHAALLPRSSSSSSSSSSTSSGKSLLARAPNPYAAMHHEKLVVGTDGTNVRDLTQRMLLKSKTTNDDDNADNGNDAAAAAAAALEPVSELQALRCTLEWSHICPTGPDSVPTVPHLESDPMVLTQWPALYFAGNAHRFATTKVVQQHDNHNVEDGDDGNNNDGDSFCRLVCIPEFASTGQAVLVNMETLNVEILRFVEDY